MTAAKALALLLSLALLCGCAAPAAPQAPASPVQPAQPEGPPTDPTQGEPAPTGPTDPTGPAGPAEPMAPARSAFDVLPLPQPNPDDDFGTDVNVNMTTIDDYLGLTDAVYRDMRMTVDPYDYEAIGGDSMLSAMIEGFSALAYPHLAPCPNMPEALGEGYTGPTLFSMDADGGYTPNYEESMAILEAAFPKDQAIILMCGAGGYAGMTKALLTTLGWDEALVFNAGGMWFYGGAHRVVTGEQVADTGLWHFTGTDLYEIDFSALTPLS